MDQFYGVLCHLDELGFEYALTILTTVTSRPTAERVITDAGFKTLSAREAGRQPYLVERPDWELEYLSAEHGNWRRPARRPRTWSSVTVSRSSPTTTTRPRSGTTQFVGLRGDVVEAVIPLLGRGKLS